MFNLKKYKLVNKLQSINLKADWINFINFRRNKRSRNELMNEILADNKFIEEDLKLRNMVEEMLVKEFTADIKNHKSYNFLIDSVVNKLKQKQLENFDSVEEAI